MVLLSNWVPCGVDIVVGVVCVSVQRFVGFVLCDMALCVKLVCLV